MYTLPHSVLNEISENTDADADAAHCPPWQMYAKSVGILCTS